MASSKAENEARARLWALDWCASATSSVANGESIIDVEIMTRWFQSAIEDALDAAHPSMVEEGRQAGFREASLLLTTPYAGRPRPKTDLVVNLPD